MSSPLCLYQRALGESFALLPPVLQVFHQDKDGAVARGTLCVRHGTGRGQRTLAGLLQFPPEGEQVPVRLQIEIHGPKERWVRQLGTQTMATWQWLQDPYLIESVGLLRFGFHLEADSGGMRFRTQHCWFLGIPLPRFLAPSVTAQVVGREQGWWLAVCLEVPRLGRLLHYEGELRPQC